MGYADSLAVHNVSASCVAAGRPDRAVTCADAIIERKIGASLATAPAPSLPRCGAMFDTNTTLYSSIIASLVVTTWPAAMLGTNITPFCGYVLASIANTPVPFVLTHSFLPLRPLPRGLFATVAFFGRIDSRFRSRCLSLPPSTFLCRASRSKER